MNPLPAPPLLVITDRWQARALLEEVAAAAFRGGCRWLSLREKDLPAAERLALAARLASIAAGFGATLTVHEDIEAAALTSGVHLPAGGDPKAARERLGPRALIGVSAHSLEAACAAEAAGADYVTFSPIYPTDSKPGYGPTQGPLALSALYAGLRIPVIALGGIGPQTVRACLDAGAAGVAVMGGVMRADDAAEELRRLLAAGGWPQLTR